MKRILILVIVAVSGSQLLEAGRSRAGKVRSQQSAPTAHITQAQTVQPAATQTPQKPCAYMIPASETLPLEKQTAQRLAALEQRSVKRRLSYAQQVAPQQQVNIQAFVGALAQYSEKDMRNAVAQLLEAAQKTKTLDAKVKEIIAALPENTPQATYLKVTLLARAVAAEIKHREKSVYSAPKTAEQTAKIAALRKAIRAKKGQKQGLLGLGVLGL